MPLVEPSVFESGQTASDRLGVAGAVRVDPMTRRRPYAGRNSDSRSQPPTGTVAPGTQPTGTVAPGGARIWLAPGRHDRHGAWRFGGGRAGEGREDGTTLVPGPGPDSADPTETAVTEAGAGACLVLTG